MTATFPIPHCTVLLGNGDRFETEHVDHLYNLHAEIHEAYPLLPLGGFRLDLVDENEEEERAIFRLILDDTYHLQTDIMLSDMGELWVFEIMFSWWLREQEEDSAYDSWSVPMVIDPSQDKHFYGQLDEEHETIVTWHDSLDALLTTYPYGQYGDKVIHMVQKKLDVLIAELKEVDTNVRMVEYGKHL